MIPLCRQIIPQEEKDVLRVIKDTLGRTRRPPLCSSYMLGFTGVDFTNLTARYPKKVLILAVISVAIVRPLTPPHAHATGDQAAIPTQASAPAGTTTGATCSSCAEKVNLDMHQKEEARLRELLARNKTVLEKIPKGESVYQKLASNILTLNIMIDTVTIKINDIFSRCPGCKGGV